MAAKVPTIESGHGHAGNDGGVEIAQEDEDHHHHQGDGQHQFKLDVGHRGLDVGGEIGEGGDVDALRQVGLQLGHQQLDALDHADGVGAGLALHVEDDRRCLVHPGGLPGVFYPVDHVGDVVQKDRSIVAIGNDYVLIVTAGDELIVGVELVVLAGPVEVALGLVDAGGHQCGADRFQVDAVVLQLGRVYLDAHRRLLAAADAHQADSAELGDFWSQAGVDQILNLRQGHGFRGDAQGQDRRVGRVGFAVDRGRGQVGGQEALRGVDGRLHFFFGDVDVEGEIELQHHHRGRAGAGGGHLAKALHFAKLALERGGHGGGHHVRAGAGVERKYLDGRVIDLRQGGDRQLRVGNDTDKHDGGHQKRGRDRPQNKWAGRTHGASLSLFEGRILALEMMTLEPSVSFSKLLSATTSPGLSPCTWVVLDSVTPGFTLCICATPF